MKQTDSSPLFPTPFGAQADSGTLTPIPPNKTAIGRASLALGFPKETFTPIAAGGVPPYGEDMNGILNMLSQAARAAEAGLVRPFNASYAQQIGGYPRGALVCDPNDPAQLFVSLYDNNGDDPTQGGVRSWGSLTGSIDTLKDALNAETQRAQNAEAGLVPLSGGTLTGALFSGGQFNPSSNISATQPIGATLEGSQFYVQLVNDAQEGTTYGRLVLRDGGGNFHVPLQVDNHDNTTLNGTLNVTGAASFQSAVLSQGTFQQGDLQMTMPIGAGFWDMQFFLQLANNAKTSTTYGRLVLKDNGGNYYVGLQIDNHGNVTDGQGRAFLSKPEASATYLPLTGGNLTGALYSANTFKQGNLALTQPIGATLEGSQFYVQLVNDAQEGTTYGRLVLRDGGGNFHVPLQVDNHDNTTLNGTLNVTGAASFQSAVLSQGTFQQGDLQMTMPIGAGFWDMQFFLQLANNAKTSTTYGRLVLKDNGGNYYVGLQIDNHGNVTDGQGRAFLSKPEASATYLPLTGGNLTGGVTITTTNNWGFGRGGGLSTLAMGDGPERFYRQVFRPQNGLTQGILGVTDETGDRQWKLQANGAIATPRGNTLLDIAGATTPMKVQSFVATTDNGFTVSFPQAFSGPPTSININAMEADWDVGPQAGTWTATGFQVTNYSSNTKGSPQLVSIIAVGPA